MTEINSILKSFEKSKSVDENIKFVIVKSNSTSVLNYTFVDKIKAHWYIWKNDITPVVEDLTFFENKMAYGINVINNTSFYLSGYPSVLLKYDYDKTEFLYENYTLLGIYIKLYKCHLIDTVMNATIVYKDNDEIKTKVIQQNNTKVK